jgi:hypothetical protein
MIQRLQTVLWPLLFCLLLGFDGWYLYSKNAVYTLELREVHTFLVENYDRALPGQGGRQWTDSSKKDEMISRAATLQPPFWKRSRHQEYLHTLHQMEEMENQMTLTSNSLTAFRNALAAKNSTSIESMLAQFQNLEASQAAHQPPPPANFQQTLSQFKSLYNRLCG